MKQKPALEDSQQLSSHTRSSGPFSFHVENQSNPVTDQKPHDIGPDEDLNKHSVTRATPKHCSRKGKISSLAASGHRAVADPHTLSHSHQPYPHFKQQTPTKH